MSVKSSKFAANNNSMKADTFRTVLPPARASFELSHRNQLLLVGSCFTEHIGQRLLDRKFKALINPFGIVFNPHSIAQSIDRLLLEDQLFTKEDLFENQGLWRSWDHHGHFAKPDRKVALEGINEAYVSAVEHVKNTDAVLLTLGTADVHYLLETGKVVANNHKMPANLFGQRRLSVNEVVENLSLCIENLKAQNPDMKVVLSVSPVRHLRSGMIENQRSKAILVLACEALCDEYPAVQYFPAYELLMDDLRDY
ncbi:MAG: GSCFA domain-containing protein, partial [Saprospiraceae bacterium]|nr:GSCFA domain-containing protein [Saprospiraceae bacterium]